MGLDITAYRKITPAVPHGFDADGDPLAEEAVRFYINSDYPGRATDVDASIAYAYADSFGFRAGSYIGYNQWRNELAKLAGYEAIPYSTFGEPEQLRFDAAAWKATDGHFWELICFADNEGVIGTAVSAKLAADFAAHQAKADAHPEDWFRNRYADWRRAFEMAADSGAVDFH